MSRRKKVTRMCLCEYCIEAMKSHGEPIAVGDLIMDEVESEEEDTPCEWCGEYMELYECLYTY